VGDYFAEKMKARREQLESSLQNVIISDGALDPPDMLYGRPLEPDLETPLRKKRKKERMEKRADAVSGNDQKEIEVEEGSLALDIDVDERRERKRQKKEEKADGSRKKKKRLKIEA
jgi:hypothetical protein